MLIIYNYKIQLIAILTILLVIMIATILVKNQHQTLTTQLKHRLTIINVVLIGALGMVATVWLQVNSMVKSVDATMYDAHLTQKIHAHTMHASELADGNYTVAIQQDNGHVSYVSDITKVESTDTVTNNDIVITVYTLKKKYQKLNTDLPMVVKSVTIAK